MWNGHPEGFAIGLGGSPTRISAVAIDGQSRIVVAGTFAGGTSQGSALVLRLLPDGKLDRSFAEKLDPYVREMYIELWQELQDAPPPD